MFRRRCSCGTADRRSGVTMPLSGGDGVSTTAEPRAVSPDDWFVEPALWADMETWHREVGAIRRSQPMLAVDGLATRRSGSSPVMKMSSPCRGQQSLAQHGSVGARHRCRFPTDGGSGMPLPKTLVHMDGATTATTAAVTNDWFKPASWSARAADRRDRASSSTGCGRSAGLRLRAPTSPSPTRCA